MYFPNVVFSNRLFSYLPSRRLVKTLPIMKLSQTLFFGLINVSQFLRILCFVLNFTKCVILGRGLYFSWWCLNRHCLQIHQWTLRERKISPKPIFVRMTPKKNSNIFDQVLQQWFLLLPVLKELSPK